MELLINVGKLPYFIIANKDFIKMTPSNIKSKIDNNSISEVVDPNVELKSNWDKPHGKRISAIANELGSDETGYLIVGVDDNGKALFTEHDWVKDTEDKVSSHIRQYLSPTAAVSVEGYSSRNGHYVMIISVTSPGDITYWDNKAYKRVGTQTQEMTPDERIDLSLKLPGQDFSKRVFQGDVSSSLVEAFAEKYAARNPDILPSNLSNLSSQEILKRINCVNRNAAYILFGKLPVRVAYYDDAGDVIDQVQKEGAFYLLTDDFIREIQRWTKTRGTVLGKDSLSASTNEPYPLKALRECLVNAVSHALYERSDAEIILDLHPTRITIRNNCTIESKAFASEWFSKKSWSRNKFLMQILRETGFADELGSGKTRLYCQMLEAGKREPLIEWYEKDNFACWQITLYNELSNSKYFELLERFKNELSSIEDARLALALTLWAQGEMKWSDILAKLDEHYKLSARRIVQSPTTPILIIGDQILMKRWVICALSGQQSVAFTSHQEDLIREILHQWAHISPNNGKVNTKEAKKLIGLSNTPSESTQLSNLFRKWRKQGILKDGDKRGEWVFV